MTQRRRAQKKKKPLVLSLFTGAGGLDLGLEAAGFSIRLCVEVDEDARKTLKTNRRGWRLAEPGDVHKIDAKSLLAQAGVQPRQIDLLAGGPPCQPFSKSAYWANGGAQGLRDPRAETLREYIRIIEMVLPRSILLENVRGLASGDKKGGGLRLIENAFRSINYRHGTNYRPQVIQLNAADYGVPQFRERVFIVASIDGRQLDMWKPTHGMGEGLLPYRTAWDAIGDLDRNTWPEELNPMGKWAALLPSIPEGQNYLWHTPRSNGQPLFGWRTRYWSFLLKLAKNQPSWTIQAQPGPATGPFHWRNRMLSMEELARLQTFPRDYRVEGNRRSAQRQLGNAVPCAIGELLGLEIRRQFFDHSVRRYLKLIPAQRKDCPPPARTERVLPCYLSLRGKHKDHPGTGRGPGARRRERIEARA